MVQKSFFPDPKKWRTLSHVFSLTGFNNLQKLGDFPSILLKGQLYRTPGLIYYTLSEGVWWNCYSIPRISKLLIKLFQALEFYLFEDLEPQLPINWQSRVLMSKKLPLPNFFYRSKTGWVFVSWRYKEGDYEELGDKKFKSFSIEVLFCSNQYVDDYFLSKNLIKEQRTISLLQSFRKDPSKLIDQIIDWLLKNKPDSHKEFFKEKIWKVLIDKRLFIDGKLNAPFNKLINTMRQALKRPPKRKKREDNPKFCLRCGRLIKGRGTHCMTCYRKRWHGLELARTLKEIGLINDFKKSVLKDKEKELILKEIRPVGPGYTFAYFERCLNDNIKAICNGLPDNKLKYKLKDYGFL